MDLFQDTRDFIEIMDSSDDDQDVRLEDFLSPEELQAAVDRSLLPFRLSPGPQNPPDRNASNPRVIPSMQIPVAAGYDLCLQNVLDVFPDISHDHVKALYDSHPTDALSPDAVPLSEEIISQILDTGKYPKERDRQNELKRKRSEMGNSDDERAAKWTNSERSKEESASNSGYSGPALTMLQEDFPDIPLVFIRSVFYEHGHLYATYLALDLADDTYDSSKPPPYYKLKRPRRVQKSVPTTPTTMYPTGYGMTELQKELEAVRVQRKKLQTQRQIKRDAIAAEAAEEKELLDNNQVIECGCCFGDIPINKITFCNADEPHAACFECTTTYVNTRIGESRHELKCIVDDGCKATYGRRERERFLNTQTIEKLERIQQQTWLREANLPNLEECPFCDFAAECPPIEVDKEFRCSNPECQNVSCRKCKVATHIPLSCEEFRKENGLSERHQIEEARSQALLRQCPKCKKTVMKDRGCNKMTCYCGAYICDFCGKDISKEVYNHFSDGPTALRIPGRGGKCPTYDDDYTRNQENMDKAEKETQQRIRKENPHISEDDLKIKMNEAVKSPPGQARMLPYAPGFMRGPPGMAAYAAYMGQMAAAGPLPPHAAHRALGRGRRGAIAYPANEAPPQDPALPAHYPHGQIPQDNLFNDFQPVRHRGGDLGAVVQGAHPGGHDHHRRHLGGNGNIRPFEFDVGWEEEPFYGDGLDFDFGPDAPNHQGRRPRR